MKYLASSAISIFIIAILGSEKKNTFSIEYTQFKETRDSLVIFFDRTLGNKVIELRDFEEKQEFPLDKYRVYYMEVDSLYILGTLPFGHTPSKNKIYHRITKDSLEQMDYWTLSRLKTMKKDSAHHFIMSYNKIFLIDANFLINDEYTLLPVKYDDRIEEN